MKFGRSRLWYPLAVHPLVLIAMGCKPGEEAAQPPQCEYRSGTPGGYGVAEPSGVLGTDLGNIDYTGGRAELSFQHERDIDEEEDGCVKVVRVYMETATNGCGLELWYAPDLYVTRLAIDDNCEGWSDEQEADYENTHDGGPTVELQDRVQGNVEEACFDSEVRLTGSVVVANYWDAELTLDLSALSVAGSVFSQAGEFSGDACPFE